MSCKPAIVSTYDFKNSRGEQIEAGRVVFIDNAPITDY